MDAGYLELTLGLMLIASMTLYYIAAIGYGFKMPYGKFFTPTKNNSLPFLPTWFFVDGIALPVMAYHVFAGDLTGPFLRRRLMEWISQNKSYEIGLISPVYMAYAQLNLWAVGLFCAYMFYRSTIYPMRCVAPRRVSWTMVVGSIGYNLMLANMLGYGLCYSHSTTFMRLYDLIYQARASESWLPLADVDVAARFAGLVMFFAGFGLTFWADSTLARLRERALVARVYHRDEGEKLDRLPRSAIAAHERRVLRASRDRRYVLPLDFQPFKWLRCSCANYLGEIIQWTGYCLATRTFASLAMAIGVFLFHSPRARQTHAFYAKTFGHFAVAGANPITPRWMLPVIPGAEDVVESPSPLPAGETQIRRQRSLARVHSPVGAEDMHELPEKQRRHELPSAAKHGSEGVARMRHQLHDLVHRTRSPSASGSVASESSAGTAESHPRGRPRIASRAHSHQHPSENTIARAYQRSRSRQLKARPIEAPAEPHATIDLKKSLFGRDHAADAPVLSRQSTRESLLAA